MVRSSTFGDGAAFAAVAKRVEKTYMARNGSQTCRLVPANLLYWARLGIVVDKTMARYPKQIPYIIGNEACERFSFYGMRNILTMYLISTLLADPTLAPAQIEANAKNIFHAFVMGVYFFPLLGGYLADRYLGKYRTILYLSIVYTIGQFCLVLFSGDKFGFFAGLSLIALGSGGIKPCVAAFVGDQFDESNKEKARSVFGLFYWIINFGSFFASISIPQVLRWGGPQWAFGIPGALMAASTVVLWYGRRHYICVPPVGPSKSSFLRVVGDAFRFRGHESKRSGEAHFLDAALVRHDVQAVEAAKAVWRLVPIFALVSIFWAIFDQKASTMVIQGRSMVRDFAGMQIAESQMQALNPLLVMALIPLLNVVIYPWLERQGIVLKALTRMGAGIALAGVAFATVAGFQLALDDGMQIHIFWQALPYFILTSAEILVSTTGLEFAYSQAPLAMKGVIMSLWNLTVTAGNFLVVLITSINIFGGAAQIFFFAVLAWIAAFVFWSISRRYVSVEHFRKV
jgi:POT family proton-dependent oligopeptide transporter